MGLEVQQEAIVKGGRDLGDPCGPSIGLVRWRRGLADHDRATSPAPKASGDPVVRLLGVKDLTHESSEKLDATEVAKQVRRFFSFGTVVAAECAVEAFSVTYRPNPVSHPGSFFFHHSKVVG
jgi:hypothetical protein